MPNANEYKKKTNTERIEHESNNMGTFELLQGVWSCTSHHCKRHCVPGTQVPEGDRLGTHGGAMASRSGVRS
eukprot:1297537-Amphidinium_carterae.1